MCAAQTCSSNAHDTENDLIITQQHCSSTSSSPSPLSPPKTSPPKAKEAGNQQKTRLLIETEPESDAFKWDSATPLERNARHGNSPDQVLTVLGSNNLYIWLIWLGTATCWALASMPMMASTFFMDPSCSPPTNATMGGESEKCSKPSSCDRLNGTLTEEFHLPTNDANMFSIPQLSTAMFLFGIILGSIVLPRLSDNMGRHPVLCFSLIISGVIGCLSALVPYVQMFVALRFLQGICFPGIGITNWVLAYESIPLKLRSYTTMMFGIWWVIGYCSIGPMAYLLPNWRWLALCASAPSIIFGALYLNFLPESFHWLASNGDEKRIRRWIDRANCFARKFGTKEAAHLQLHEFCVANQIRAHPKSSEIENAAPKGDSNQKEVDQNDDSSNEALIKDESDKGSDQGKAQQQQLSMLTPMAAVDPHEQLDKAANKKSRFVKSQHRIRIYTAIFAYLWTANTFIYYGLSLFSTKLVGDIYLNYVFVGLVEIPSYIVSPFLLDKMGRKIFIASAHFLAAITYTVIVVNDLLPLDCPLESVTFCMWLVGKFAISCSFTSLFVYASEVFPTVSRNSNIGVCAACSRVGAVLVPFVKQMSRELQLGLYGVVSLLAAIITLCLPETKNQSLPASSAEVPRRKSHDKVRN